MSYLSKEFEIIARLTESADPAVRELLLQQLEGMPVDKCTFYERWRRIYDVGEFHCWTETDYDPTLSRWPRDIQLLGAVEYGKEDIDNGGLHQFFGNPTGILAPEMCEWCERSGLSPVADILREAMVFFGEPYPRPQWDRRKMLTDRIEQIGFERGRDAWDPFRDLDSRFYDKLDNSTFDRTADHWLREVCGIRSLRHLPPGVFDHVLFTNQFVRAFWDDVRLHPDDEPVEQSLDELLGMVRYLALPANDSHAFRIRMVNPFSEPLYVTFRQASGWWSVTAFEAGEENLFAGPAADNHRVRLNRVFETCRNSLMPTAED